MLDTAIATYRITARQLPYALKIAWPWLVLLVLLGQPFTPFQFFDLLEEDRIEETIYPGIILLNVIIYVSAWSSIAVLWHRRILLGEESMDFIIVNKSAVNYLRRYIWIAINVALLMFLILIPFAIIAIIFDAIFDLSHIDINLSSSGKYFNDFDFLIYLLNFAQIGWTEFVIALPFFGLSAMMSLRFSVSLPAAALENSKITPDSAWTVTQGNSIRLFSAMLLASIPYSVAMSILKYCVNALYSSESVLSMLLTNVLWNLGSMVLILIAVTFLSVAYAFFIDDLSVEYLESSRETRPIPSH